MLNSQAVGAVGDAVDGQADAVDGDRALVGQERASSRGARTRSSQLSPDRREVADVADAVDMAGDDVAAQPVVRAQRLFQVDGPRLVQAGGLVQDSAEMSMVNCAAAGSRVVTVMQAPLSAMLSPSRTSSR